MPESPEYTKYQSQMKRELNVGIFLGITQKEWKNWVRSIDDSFLAPELHEHVVNIVKGLETGDAQIYIQALALLSDESLEWLVLQFR